MPAILQEIEEECCAGLISKAAAAAQGDAMTSWEILYPDRTWVTGDDADDAQHLRPPVLLREAED